MKPMLPGMPWGQYQGKLWANIPTAYLHWVLAECDLRPQLRARIEIELAERGQRQQSQGDTSG